MSRHQWPLSQWAELNAPHRRDRRKDTTEMILLDPEVFRRESIGSKPEWKDPEDHQNIEKERDEDWNFEIY